MPATVEPNPEVEAVSSFETNTAGTGLTDSVRFLVIIAMKPATQLERLLIRPKEYYFWCGILSLLLVAFMCSVALFEFFVHGKPDAIIPALLLTGLLGSSGCYLIALRLRGFVEINEHEIAMRGASTIRRIPWSEVRTVDWKWPGRMFVLRSSTNRISIDPLMPFERDTALPLIELVRDRTAHAEQNGWPEYVHHVALPLRKRQSSREQINDETHIWSTRRRLDRLMSAVCAIFLAIGLTMFFVLQQWRFLTAPLLPFALWMFIRFSIPKSGEPTPRVRMQPGSKYVSLMMWWTLASIMTLCLGQIMGIENELAMAAWTIATVGGMIFLAFQVERERNAQIRAGAAASLEEWNRS